MLRANPLNAVSRGLLVYGGVAAAVAVGWMIFQAHNAAAAAEITPVTTLVTGGIYQIRGPLPPGWTPADIAGVQASLTAASNAAPSWRNVSVVGNANNTYTATGTYIGTAMAIPPVPGVSIFKVG